MKKNVAAFIAVQHVVIYKTQGYHNSETVGFRTDVISISLGDFLQF